MNFNELNINDINSGISEENKMALEEQVMGIIINSGEARSCAYKALTLAKQGEFSQAAGKLEEARLAANLAHQVQTQLIEADMGEGKTTMTLIMVHAQDHLMTSILARELVSELIDIYKKMAA
jgi:PTS system cellobiose-specific IIA component